MPDYEAAVGKSIKGMKIGIPKEYRLDGMAAEIDALWQRGAQWLQAAGAEIVEVSLPHTKYALPAYYIVAPAEASSNLARYDGVRYGLRVPGRDIIDMYQKTRAEGFGPEVRRRIMIGTYMLSTGYYDAYYLRAQKVRTLIKRDFEDCFAAGVNAILTPATPSAAFGIGEKGRDPVEMYLNDVFTVTVNMAGLPGIAVPGGLVGGGPAARAAAHRPPVRRGDAVLAGAGDRGRRRPVHAGDVVVGRRASAWSSWLTAGHDRCAGIQAQRFRSVINVRRRSLARRRLDRGCGGQTPRDDLRTRRCMTLVDGRSGARTAPLGLARLSAPWSEGELGNARYWYGESGKAAPDPGHLHRVEWDLGNARYWYGQAGKAVPPGHCAPNG